MSVTTKQSPKSTKAPYVLPTQLKELAVVARKAATDVTSATGTLAQAILRFDTKVGKLPKADRSKARTAFSVFIMEGRPKQSRRSISSLISQIRRAAEASKKAAASWLAGKYGEYTVKGVLRAAKQRNQKATRFSAAREAKHYTVAQLTAMLVWRKANPE